MEEDEEVEFEIAKGVGANIKYKAMGELQPNGAAAASGLGIPLSSWDI